MYLKDPIKRVQYTFRIKEPLMEDLKVYAKAKDIKLPRLINDILEDHIKNMNLRRNKIWKNGSSIISQAMKYVTADFWDIRMPPTRTRPTRI